MGALLVNYEYGSGIHRRALDTLQQQSQWPSSPVGRQQTTSPHAKHSTSAFANEIWEQDKLTNSSYMQVAEEKMPT